MARKGQITVVIVSAMLTGHNVLDVMRERTDILRQEAIFAMVPGPGSDQYPGR